MQITDGVTGVTGTDGFKIGTSNGVAEVRQQENEEMRFFTNDTERMKITNKGQVLIHSLECERCFVMSDKEGKLYAKQNDTPLSLEEGLGVRSDCEIAALETRVAMLESKVHELTALLSEK